MSQLDKEFSNYVKCLTECNIIQDWGICEDIIKNISSFAVNGHIFNCSCVQEEEIYIDTMTYLQDQQNEMEIYFNCNSCNQKSVAYKCKNCIDIINTQIWFGDCKYQYSKLYPPSQCLLHTQCGMKQLCGKCYFICGGCNSEMCFNKHFSQQCTSCNAKYCTKNEIDATNCWLCQNSLCVQCNAANKHDHGGKHLNPICNDCFKLVESEWREFEDIDMAKYEFCNNMQCSKLNKPEWGFCPYCGTKR